jgi:DNA-binding transcriptional LysR family regulator
MELRHLRYFAVVAEELSFSRAAERLHMAQPPLSQQIRDLERELKLELFDRSHRKIQLTSAGKDLLADARAVLESVSRLEYRAQLRAEGHLGRLAIGVNTAIVTPAYFAELLRKFQNRNPGVVFTMIDYNSQRQVEALLANEIDVGFLRPSAAIPAQVVLHRINRQVMRIALPEHHSLAKKRRVAWRDLANENFVVVQRDIAGDFYNDFYTRCRNAGFEPKIKQYVSNTATLFWLVSAGMGIAPTPTAQESASGVTFVALPADAPVYETALAWRQSDASPVLERFVQFVKSSPLPK